MSIKLDGRRAPLWTRLAYQSYSKQRWCGTSLINFFSSSRVVVLIDVSTTTLYSLIDWVATLILRGICPRSFEAWKWRPGSVRISGRSLNFFTCLNLSLGKHLMKGRHRWGSASDSWLGLCHNTRCGIYSSMSSSSISSLLGWSLLFLLGIVAPWWGNISHILAITPVSSAILLFWSIRCDANWDITSQLYVQYRDNEFRTSSYNLIASFTFGPLGVDENRHVPECRALELLGLLSSKYCMRLWS